MKPARGVRVVDADQGLISLRQLADLVHLGDRPVHREDAVRDDELEFRFAGLDELVLEVVHVVVAVDEALGLGQPHAVDDRGMVELVGDDGAFLVEERLEDAAVGVEGRGIEDGVLHAQEVGHAPLELSVDLLGAADEADRGQAKAPAEEGIIRSGHDPGVVAEAQVVVGAEVEDLGPRLRPDLDALGRLEDALPLVKAPLADLPELGVDVLFESSVHGTLCRKAEIL
jgi:hypothetical protein